MTDFLNTTQLSLGGQRGQSAGGVAVVGPSSGPIDFQVGSLAMKCVSSDPRAGTITAGSLQTTTAGAGYVPGSYSDVPLAGGTVTATADIVVATNGQLHSAIVTNGGYGYTKDDVLTNTTIPPVQPPMEWEALVGNVDGNGAILTVTNLIGGHGYTPGTTTGVGLTDSGSGSGAIATIIVDATGVVTSVSITTGGTGYESIDTLRNAALPTRIPQAQWSVTVTEVTEAEVHQVLAIDQVTNKLYRQAAAHGGHSDGYVVTDGTNTIAANSIFTGTGDGAASANQFRNSVIFGTFDTGESTQISGSMILVQSGTADSAIIDNTHAAFYGDVQLGFDPATDDTQTRIRTGGGLASGTHAGVGLLIESPKTRCVGQVNIEGDSILSGTTTTISSTTTNIGAANSTVVINGSTTVNGSVNIGSNASDTVIIGDFTNSPEVQGQLNFTRPNANVFGMSQMMFAYPPPGYDGTSQTYNIGISKDVNNRWGLVVHNSLTGGAGDYTYTGDHSHTGTITHSGTVTHTGSLKYTGVQASGFLELDANGNVVSNQSAYSHYYSGNTARVNVGHNITGNWEHTGTTTFSNAVYKSKGAAPASASATGTEGEIRWDTVVDPGLGISNHYMYLCVATDTWTRVEMGSWQ